MDYPHLKMASQKNSTTHSSITIKYNSNYEEMHL